MTNSWAILAVSCVIAAVGSAGCMGSEDPENPIDTSDEVVLLAENEGSDNPIASWSAPVEEGLTAENSPDACWVWLDYCVDPRTGTGTCHQNGGCTNQQFINACVSLYEDTCF